MPKQKPSLEDMLEELVRDASNIDGGLHDADEAYDFTISSWTGILYSILDSNSNRVLTPKEIEDVYDLRQKSSTYIRRYKTDFNWRREVDIINDKIRARTSADLEIIEGIYKNRLDYHRTASGRINDIKKKHVKPIIEEIKSLDESVRTYSVHEPGNDKYNTLSIKLNSLILDYENLLDSIKRRKKEKFLEMFSGLDYKKLAKGVGYSLWFGALGGFSYGYFTESIGEEYKMLATGAMAGLTINSIAALATLAAEKNIKLKRLVESQIMSLASSTIGVGLPLSVGANFEQNPLLSIFGVAVGAGGLAYSLFHIGKYKNL